uniref:Uncharacterized protein n=1 Tax=Cucumis melo TaxID=3656 RepID=A0A9I9E5X3_CUCME
MTRMKREVPNRDMQRENDRLLRFCSSLSEVLGAFDPTNTSWLDVFEAILLVFSIINEDELIGGTAGNAAKLSALDIFIAILLVSLTIHEDELVGGTADSSSTCSIKSPDEEVLLPSPSMSNSNDSFRGGISNNLSLQFWFTNRGLRAAFFDNRNLTSRK